MSRTAVKAAAQTRWRADADALLRIMLAAAATASTISALAAYAAKSAAQPPGPLSAVSSSRR
jgi:hypothetical protein